MSSDLSIIEPWERREGESEPAFEAFRLYRDLGSERSLAKVVEATGKDRAQIHRWSTRHDWVERGRLFDIEEDRRDREETAKEKKKALKRHAAIAARAAVSLGQRLQGDERADIEKLDPNDIEWENVPALLRATIWGERLAYGEPTDLVKGAVAISLQEAGRVLNEVVQIALEELPEERHAIFVQRVEALGGLTG